ncbi:MAG: hypothetical protein A2Y62_16870 [Candidatus Fischerbacteria bacterium RBG_13_37_8]|uniref:Thioredoxin-like fold domain-containing protein n=1 Tax=Candidatus Fischerbacteria bacterium RBG_13_37_8 TaxID=1817863 RepID=A0A1F5VF99_9BACT|nr:MAG: hypothetical protein A2Y62_16870 [Candidatus Fischerbacteria bacterium RBG_13_37_8]
MSAYDAAKFVDIHNEIFENFEKGKDPVWRAKLAKKYGVEAALTDQKTKDIVGNLIHTAVEYEKTHEKYPYGIRSTPTMIINNRMVIGTLPYPHLKAIFESLLSQQGTPGEQQFMENWVE